MKTEEELYQLIDCYLQGKLPPDHDFVKQLEQDPDLAQEVEVQSLLINAVIDNRLLKVQEEITALRPPSSGNSKKYHVVKTLVALLTTMGLVYLVFNKTSKTVPIVAKKEKIALQKEILTPNNARSALPITKATKAEVPLHSTSRILSKSKEIEKREEKAVPVEALETEKEANLSNAGFTKAVELGKQEKLEEKKLPIPIKEELVAPTMKKAREEARPDEIEAKKKIIMESHVFEPNRETWEVPTDIEKGGKLSIFDKNGHSVYKREFSKTEKITWDGTALTGGMLASTVYVYLIEYSDGSTQQGTVTLSY